MSATCEHREFLPEDEAHGFATGPVCGEPALWLSCSPIVDQPVCEKHRCRCRKPIGSPPDGNQRLIDALVAALNAKGD